MTRPTPPFQPLQDAAAARCGGSKALQAALPEPLDRATLSGISDDRWLAAMTRSVFRAGFVWKVVEAKWPGFEAAFDGFDSMSCAMLSDEALEALCADTRIIRHATKIRSVRDNAAFVRRIRESHGSFASWIAQWPEDDIVGLWQALKSGGARLGGNSGPMTLRSMGKDTFLLTGDVTRALLRLGVLDRPTPGQRALHHVMGVFNEWRADTGRPLCQLSRILALSSD